MRSIRVAAVQMEHAAGYKAANLATIETFVLKAAEEGVGLIAFPECCITGYWFLRKLPREEIVALAEPVPDGPASRRLAPATCPTRIRWGASIAPSGTTATGTPPPSRPSSGARRAGGG